VSVATSYPGVYVREIPSGVRTIGGVATSICAFIGWAPKGSTERPDLVLSFADYERKFGGCIGSQIAACWASFLLSPGQRNAKSLNRGDGCCVLGSPDDSFG